MSNIRILSIDGDDMLLTANFQLYRTRLASEEDCWIGRREDLLRRVEGRLKLARRHIFLEQTVILAQNMSNLF
ncbi:MAG: aromatic-ring-hydroxylating dioxygenase subunit beta [Gammaproteobacteria bacterium]